MTLPLVSLHSNTVEVLDEHFRDTRQKVADINQKEKNLHPDRRKHEGEWIERVDEGMKEEEDKKEPTHYTSSLSTILLHISISHCTHLFPHPFNFLFLLFHFFTDCLIPLFQIHHFCFTHLYFIF